MKWSLVFTFFRSLSLAHLERSLYSLSRQTLKPDELVFFENNTDYAQEQIEAVIQQHFRLTDWKLHFNKHRDPAKTTASWCQNTAIRLAQHPVFLLAKADCIYDFGFYEELVSAFDRLSCAGANPMFFTACWLFQMPYLSKASHEAVDHTADLEPLRWREDPQRLLQNDIGAQMHCGAVEDAACFCSSKPSMETAGWYDEELRSWGYWQSDLQKRMQSKGVKFCVIPKPLYFHMLHDVENGSRDEARGHAEYLASSRRKG